MTVKELIAFLKKLPQDDNVFFLEEDIDIYSPVLCAESKSENAQFIHIDYVGDVP